MLVFKLEDQTMDKVTRIFETLQALISLDIYKNLFQFILTDNRHKFFDVNNIECIHQLANMLLIFFWVIHTPLDKFGKQIATNHTIYFM